MQVNKGSDILQPAPSDLGLSTVNFGDDVKLIILCLTKVNPLDGAWINNGWVGVLVKVLRFVNMTEGNVVQPGIADERAGQDHICAQHDGPL